MNAIISLVLLRKQKRKQKKMSIHSYESAEEYLEAKNGATGLVVVKFGAVWCGPCRKIAPKFAKLASSHPDVLCIDVDVDKLDGLSDASDVRGVPCFKFFKNNIQVDTFAGANEQKLEEFFEQYS